jgi:hypothetical protein
MGARTDRRVGAALGGLAALLAFAPPAHALILKTTNAGEVATFSTGMNVEEFEGTIGTALSSYAPGQLVENGSLFSSLDHATQPTFHSGGADPNDPEGNPGTPIGIIDPSGAIAADVVSGVNVASPLVINTQEPFNNAFMEVIFFPGLVERVGFWITHGSVTLTLRDRQVNDLTTGDVTVTGVEGEFIGISRGTSDIAIAAVFAAGGGDSYTFDDFVYADSVPEPGGPLLLAVGAAALASARATSARRRSRPAAAPPS